MVFPCKNIRLGLLRKRSHTSFSTDTANASTRRASSLAGGRSIVGAGRLLRLALQTWSTEKRAINFCEHTKVDWEQMAEGGIPMQHVGCICGHRGVVEREEGPVVGTSISINYFGASHIKSCVYHVIYGWMIIGFDRCGTVLIGSSLAKYKTRSFVALSLSNPFFSLQVHNGQGCRSWSCWSVLPDLQHCPNLT
jgi:hypothetical protein